MKRIYLFIIDYYINSFLSNFQNKIIFNNIKNINSINNYYNNIYFSNRARKGMYNYNTSIRCYSTTTSSNTSITTNNSSINIDNVKLKDLIGINKLVSGGYMSYKDIYTYVSIQLHSTLRLYYLHQNKVQSALIICAKFNTATVLLIFR